MRKCLVAIFLCNSIINTMPTAFGQKKDQGDSSTRYLQLHEVVISGNKFAENKKNVVQKIDIITSSYIARANAQNTGDLLAGTGNVFVQKSQQGGSSPVIRGFEASRILLVVDGVRLNNAVYRAGHLQNVITVDQNMLDRVEVLNGPSSTLYGSDALGGTIHLMTKQVHLSENEVPLVRGSFFTRYSSANDEKTGHFDINLGYKKIGFLTSVNYSDFGDMKMGNNYPDKFPDFGRRTYYIAQVNGSLADSVMKNNDDRRQRFSGYRQWDLLQKILIRQNEKVNHIFNIQYSNSGDIPRYDRLQDIRNGTLRYASWYYGPQKRTLYAYTLQAGDLHGFFNKLRLTASFQDISESRQTREYRRYDRFESRRERIKVGGFTLDLWKKWGAHELSTGVDIQLNQVRSVADRTNLLTGQVMPLDTRYPNGKNNMNAYALFVQHIFKSGKFVFNDGIRFQATSLRSTIKDNSFFNLPVTDIRQDPFAVTGNIGVAYTPEKSTRLSLGLSSGFRAPNIDDVSRIFESSTAQQRVVVPNPGIKPEYTWNAELGISHLMAGKVKAEITAWYTLFTNAINLAPYTLNGMDSIDYNGIRAQVVANTNINKANLFGFSATISGDLGEYFSFLSTWSYTRGNYKVNPEESTTVFQKQPDGKYALVKANVSGKPLDHIPPLFGKTSILYRYNRFNAELFSLYNGWKKLDRYNPDGEDNPQYATAEGMPAWITFNLRTAFRITNQIQLQFSVENILDRNYRYFASGISAPGRNFIFALRANF